MVLRPQLCWVRGIAATSWRCCYLCQHHKVTKVCCVYHEVNDAEGIVHEVGHLSHSSYRSESDPNP